MLFYLDDGTIGGSLESLASGLQIIEKKGLELGLRLNITKSELICKEESAAHCQVLLSEFPRLQVYFIINMFAIIIVVILLYHHHMTFLHCFLLSHLL